MFKLKEIKNAALCCLLSATTITAWSQVSNYTFAQSSTTYTPITGGTVLSTGSIDDGTFDARPIGFTFTYCNANYTTFSVSANGYINLGNNITGTYNCISDPSALNNSVAVYCADLQGFNNAELRFQTLGTSPNRTLVVQFSNWSHYGISSDDLNFQVRLNESSNTVQIVYGSFVRGITDKYIEVGLRGSNYSDFNNRTSATGWATTTAGITNNATIRSNGMNSIIPSNGLTFTWAPTSCPLPTNLNTTGTSTTTALIEWSAPSNAPSAGYDWQIVPQGNAVGSGVVSSGTASGTSSVATGLSLGTPYTLYIRGNCGSTQSSYVSYNFTFAYCNGLMGNGQSNAIVVNSFPFTYNFSATSWSCYNNNYEGRQGSDVYFRFVADSCATSITVNTCNTAANWDNYLTVLAANGTTPVAVADDVCGNLASATFAPMPGATYYVVIEPYNAIYGSDFRLDITQTTDAPASILSLSTQLGCFDEANGQVSVTTTGGTAPFTYAWSNGFTETRHATTSTISGLTYGTYNVTVSNGCGGTSSASTYLTAFNQITITLTPTNASSANATDGSITSNVSSSVVDYLWSNGSTSANLSGVPAGSYTLTITDANGCSASATTIINAPTGITDIQGLSNFNMFPNPSEGNVSITFDLATAQNVSLSIIDVNGRLVKYVESGAQSAIAFNIDLSDLNDGVYMARFNVGNEVFARPIVLMK